MINTLKSMPESFISCVIPAFNEEKTIADVVKIVKNLKKRETIAEIIVVSDGSTDNTAQKAREAGADFVIEIKKNIGKGGAIIEGVKKSSQDILLFLDADLINLNSEHILQIIEPVIKNKTDMTVGFLADMQSQNLLRYFSGQRAIKRNIVEKAMKSKKLLKSRFQFETLLNRFARKIKSKIIFIPLHGLRHIKKENKYTPREALIMRTEHLVDMFFRAFRNYLFIGIFSGIAIAIYVIFFSPVKIIGNLHYMPPPTAQDKILIIAAHPDDEVLGVGGYITEAVKNGAQVRVIIATNGDANKFSVKLADKNVFIKKENLIEEGLKRIQESRSALSLSNIPQDRIYFLSFPDKELKNLLSKYWMNPEVSKYTKLNETSYQEAYKQNIPYTGENLLRLMEEIISTTTPTIIITHNPRDSHPDHEAAYKFASLAINELTKKNIIEKPKMYYFLIHWQTFEFPRPFRLEINAPLYPPHELKKICDWALYPLPKETEDLKLKQIRTFKSQLKNPYLRLLLESFARTNELFCINIKRV